MYSECNYESAIEKYESIISAGFESAELYYNLANAYYKSNKNTKAILNYERALRLSPSNEDIKFNLELSQQHIIDKIEILPQVFYMKWWRNLISIYNSNYWAYISIVLFILALLIGLLYFLGNRIVIKKTGFWFGIIFMLFSIIGFYFSYNQKVKYLNHNEAIIFEPTVVVKSSPDESGTDLFVIHEGLKVIISDDLGNWNQVKLTDGNKGWILKKHLERI